ncbi:MAG TPA: PQQ-binding-like beta-propeller repeat protein [Vicinamibacterales bacterium]|nr:PQQ-binding-like beta-propeller repeat protein [Vicinamibacterales bacterium]
MRVQIWALTGVLAVLAGGTSANQPAPANWPRFRGPDAAGIADGEQLPTAWNGPGGTNIRWKVPIAGLSHSSPIVWGDRLFLTSAISSRADATFKPGLYGEGTASEDRSSHKWVLTAIDRRTGKTLWQRTAYEGVPKEKRHIKSTYASSTPVTDGRIVVAYFGSQGLHAFDLNGKPLWRQDLGRLDVGAYDLPEYEWGTASSPIIDNGLVIVQADQQKGSFLIAFKAATGEMAWKTMRDELPSWGTPNVYRSTRPGRAPELVTNASNFIRGYDPATGKELWRLGGSSKITAPTPVFTDDFILVASGRRDEKPIFVIRPGARGDITLGAAQTSNDAVAWSKRGRGPYMPTPLIYRGQVYVINNDGIFDAYDLATGREIYRDRIPHPGSGFSASPVVSDGRIFLSSEDGDMFVVAAGPKFSIVATNHMGEPLMATPAIVDRTMYVRAQQHLFAIGAPATRAEPSASSLGVGPRREEQRIASLRAPERARAGVGPREQ